MRYCQSNGGNEKDFCPFGFSGKLSQNRKTVVRTCLLTLSGLTAFFQTGDLNGSCLRRDCLGL